MDNVVSDLTVEFGEVQAVLLVIIQLCQRNSNKMDEAGREVIHHAIFSGLQELLSVNQLTKTMLSYIYEYVNAHLGVWFP